MSSRARLIAARNSQDLACRGGKNARAAVPLECSFPSAAAQKQRFCSQLFLHVVRRAKNWERRGTGCLPPRLGSALVRRSAEEALSMRRPTNAILRTAVFISGEIAWHFRATPDMASHLTFGAPRAINMTMRETRNQAFSSNGHPSFSFINFGT